MLFERRAKDADGVLVYKCTIGHERILTLSDSRKIGDSCAQCDYEKASVFQFRILPAPIEPEFAEPGYAGTVRL